MGLSKTIAKDLLDIEAIQLKTNEADYFTWASGIRSPIYCDNRLIISYPTTRKKVVEAWVNIIEKSNMKPDLIAGCATGGIPHAAWLAEALDLPMVYVRSKPKGHGTGSQIEGYFEKGQNVLVIEDLISTGGSAIEATKALQNEGLEVVHVLAIFTYGLAISQQNFAEINVPFQTILTFDELLDVLVTEDKMTDNEKDQLLTWRNER